ncbi:glycosyltransferase [Trinickia dabaoshanensis]|uniref:glycosyltransferase n=1 Tax=Trinickia dabaoshanensis TaxID=564714 RepID=UPI0011AEF760|nr:glycosyltransferase [Trinickia dabaoshanensis]
MNTSADSDSQRHAGALAQEAFAERTSTSTRGARSLPGAAVRSQRPVVLIVEPDFTGHRWRYAQWAAQAFAEAGHPCVIATHRANAGHPLAREIANAQMPGVSLALIDDPEPASAFALQAERIPYVRYHRYFAHAYASVSACTPIGFAVVPYVDYFIHALPLLGSPFRDTPWIGITMRTTFHHRHVGVKTPDRPLVNAIKANLFRRALRAPGLRTLLSIDPTLPEWSVRPGALKESSASILYLADPFPDAAAGDSLAARSRLGLGPGPHLLVYGSITERKGIRELVAALARMTRPPTLVVAGQQDEATRAFLHLHGTRLTPQPRIIDRFIDNDMELDLFRACDVVWLGYTGHYGMSGVLVQAYRFGKCVIATSEGLIGWFCAGETLGPVLEDLSAQSIAHAVDRALAGPHCADRPLAADAHAALLERNTLAAFKRTLRHAARGCVNCLQ